MAHESFENPEDPELMNDKFIHIKVRPQKAAPISTAFTWQAGQLLLGTGGGPKTGFSNPPGEAFFGGT